jgi:hypothetical protein
MQTLLGIDRVSNPHSELLVCYLFTYDFTFFFSCTSRYALGIDLPEFVATDPIIMALNQYTNDLVTWSNVSQNINAFVVVLVFYLLLSHNRALNASISLSRPFRIYFRTMLNRPEEIRTT